MVFDAIKKTLFGGSSSGGSSFPSGKGYVLGSAAQSQPSSTSSSSTKQKNVSSSSREAPQSVGDSAAEYELFERVFVQETLGLAVVECTDALPVDDPSVRCASRPLVSEVKANAEAAQHGVCAGDIIIALNGSAVLSTEEFTDLVACLGRPIAVQFYRPLYNRNSTAKRTSSSSLRPQSTTNSNRESLKAPPAETEEERERKREAMRIAALERATQWDKKVSIKSALRETSSKQNSPFSNENDAEGASPTLTPIETSRAVEATKKGEAQLAQELGYSPFRTHMSSASSAVNSISSAAAVPTQTAAPNLVLPGSSSVNGGSIVNSPAVNLDVPISPEEEEEVAQMTADVDDAFAMLISLADIEQSRVQTAVQTIQKMLTNIANNKKEPKFRSIRITNQAFYNKVASVSGGIELLLAAGYQPDSSPFEGTKQLDRSTSDKFAYPALEIESLANTNGEEYLVHSMDKRSERRLHYVLSRLPEILDLQKILS